jgi:type III restriction enzyme
VEIGTIDDYYAPIESDEKESMTISERQIEFISKNLFKNMMSPFTNRRSISPMNVAWFMLCENLFGPSLVKDDFLSTQSFLILNKSKIEPVFIRAVNKYSKLKEKKVKQDIEHRIENFEIIKEDYFNSHVTEKDLLYSKHVLQPCYLNKNRSNPEKEFEKILDKSKKIKWWYKNGEMRKDYFGIRYEYDNKDGEDNVHTFYPDYIVQFNDGKIGIFETKDKSDQDAHTKTKAKAEELQRYIERENKKGKNILGGIIVFKDKEWQIHSGKEYSLDKDWKKLDL